MQAQELLNVLADGDTVSGAALAERAGVTRAAIWKQIEALRARGVPVESRGTAGYCLPWPIQLLSLPAMRAAVPGMLFDAQQDHSAGRGPLQGRGELAGVHRVDPVVAVGAEQ